MQKNKPKAWALGSFSSVARKSVSAIENGRKSIKKTDTEKSVPVFLWKKWGKRDVRNI